MTKGEFKKPTPSWQQGGGQKTVLKGRNYDRTQFQRPDQRVTNANLMKMVGTVRSVILEDITYKTLEDMELRLDLYLPRTKVFQFSPVVVFFHGGMFLGGEKNDIPIEVSNIFQDLRNAGFAVVNANYRIPTDTIRYPAPVQDAKDVIRWLKKNHSRYDIDPERIGVWGMSAGALLALLVAFGSDPMFPGHPELAVYSSQVNFGISWSGLTDLTNWDGQAQPPETIAAYVAYLMGGTIAELPEAYQQASPIFHVTEKSPPILLLHGSVDAVIPCSQSQRLYDYGQQSGLPYHYFPVENAGHGYFEFMKEEITPPFEDIREMTVAFCRDILGI